MFGKEEIVADDRVTVAQLPEGYARDARFVGALLRALGPVGVLREPKDEITTAIEGGCVHSRIRRAMPDAAFTCRVDRAPRRPVRECVP
jgi:hypothetical protein